MLVNDTPTSRFDKISSTLFGRTAPLTPLVTILTGVGGKSGVDRRISLLEVITGDSSNEDEGDCVKSCFCLMFALPLADIHL